MTEPATFEAGQRSPAFTAKDAAGNTHDLNATLAEGKHVILYFYPRDSTPGCTTQACDFRDNMARLNTESYVVWGVSKDSARSHDNFSTKQDLNFPLLLSLIHI